MKDRLIEEGDYRDVIEWRYQMFSGFEVQDCDLLERNRPIYIHI